MKKQETINRLNMVLDDFIETHRDVAEVEPTNASIELAFRNAINALENQRKAPKDWATWADFARCYDLVLFNQCVNIGNGEVLDEWTEKHLPECEDYQESGECNCEVYQWYAIGVSDFDAEYLNKRFNLDIFYSDTLDIYILPVYHYGTAWDGVPLSMNNPENHG